MKTLNIRGSVAGVGADVLTVRSHDQGDLRLQVSESTAVNLDGQTVGLVSTAQGILACLSAGVRGSMVDKAARTIEALQNSGVDKYDIPAFLRKQAD